MEGARARGRDTHSIHRLTKCTEMGSGRGLVMGYVIKRCFEPSMHTTIADNVLLHAVGSYKSEHIQCRFRRNHAF